MNTLFGFLVVLATMQTPSLVPKLDMSALVGERQEVTIKNPGGIANTYIATTLLFNSSCVIMPKGRLEVIGVEGENVLVRYGYPLSYEEAIAQPPLCPSGTLSWFDLAKFLGLESEFHKGNTIAEEIEMYEIRRLLDNFRNSGGN